MGVVFSPLITLMAQIKTKKNNFDVLCLLSELSFSKLDRDLYES